MKRGAERGVRENQTAFVPQNTNACYDGMRPTALSCDAAGDACSKALHFVLDVSCPLCCVTYFVVNLGGSDFSRSVVLW